MSDLPSSYTHALPRVLCSKPVCLLIGPCTCQAPSGPLHCSSFGLKRLPASIFPVIPLLPSDFCSNYHQIGESFSDYLCKVLVTLTFCIFPHRTYDLPTYIIYFLNTYCSLPISSSKICASWGKGYLLVIYYKCLEWSGTKYNVC